MNSVSIAVGAALWLSMSASAQFQFVTQARSVKAQSAGMPLLTSAAPDFGLFVASVQSIGTEEAHSNGLATASQNSTLGTAQMICYGGANPGYSNAFFSGYGTAQSKHTVTFTVAQDTPVNFVASVNYASVSLTGPGINFAHGYMGSGDHNGTLLAGQTYTVYAESIGEIQLGHALGGDYTYWLTAGGMPPKPTSPHSSVTSAVCPGTAVQLSVAEPPAGHVIDWYWNSVLQATGASVTVYAAGGPNQTFWAQTRRVSDGAVSMQQTSITVPVISATKPTSASVNRNNLCMYDGGTIQLTAAGGNSTTYQWFAGDCGGPMIGTGATITIPAPNVTTTYYVRCFRECAVGPCNSRTVEVRACPSDFTCDGSVADDDFSTFAISYNLMLCSDPAMPAGCHADLNGDGFVDDADFLPFVIAYDALNCQ